MSNDQTGCPSEHPQETPQRILTREGINGKFTERIYARVNVEGIGVIRIQSLTAREHHQLRQWLNADNDDVARKRWANIHAAMVCWCAVDENGNRLFRTSEVEAGTFDNWRGGVLTGLGEACEQLTGFTARAYSVEAVEDEVKN